MAVSNNPDLVTTGDDILRDAFTELNLYGAEESIPPIETARAFRLLNRMIKSWQNQGYHLWLKQTVTLFTKQTQNLYTLSSTSTDHATDTYYQTTLTQDAQQSDDEIYVESVDNMTVGDYVGVMLDDNDIFWGTIKTIGSVNKVVFFDPAQSIPSLASTGNVVYSYTNKLDSPLNVYSMVRTIDDRDIPMNYLSYEEYFQLPNKSSPTNTPVSYNYDRQRDEAIIRLWPTPNTSKILIKLTIARRIYTFVVNSNNPDVPEQWYEPLVLNLAVRMAPSFGKNKDAGFQTLQALAAQALSSALEFDNEPGSIYFQPNFRNA